MRIKIHAGQVGVIGASIAALGALGGGVAIGILDDCVLAQQGHQRDLQERHDRSWNSHQLADTRQQHAETIFIEALTQDAGLLQNSLYEMADGRYRDAWITMGAAAEMDLDTLIASEDAKRQEAVASLPEDDRHERSVRLSMIDTLRLESRSAMNSLAAELRDSAATLDRLRSWRSMAFYLGLAFTVLGSIVTAVKDFPVFRP